MPLTLTAPLTAPQQAALDLLYTDSCELLDRTVRAFCNAYGGDWDTLRADANSIFIEAWHRYTGAAPWHTHLNIWVWNELYDALRQDRGYRRKYRVQYLGDAVLQAAAGPVPGGFDVEQVTASLSTDAATVLRMATDLPTEVAAVAAARGGTPRNLRSSLRAYLREMGWTAARVSESFAEIRSVL